MLYLPLGLLAGLGLARVLLGAFVFIFGQSRGRGWGMRSSPRTALRGLLTGRNRALRLVLNGGLILVALALGVADPRALRPDPGWSYVTADDLTALGWVAAHTPPQARFLISAASTYQGRAVTAADAGMWLPLLTGQDRQTSVPPLSAGAEGAQAADYAAHVQALYTASLSPTLASNLAVLQQAGIGYVFLGEHTPTISPTVLQRDHADYCLLYRQGNSFVFGLRGAPSAPCAP